MSFPAMRALPLLALIGVLSGCATTSDVIVVYPWYQKSPIKIPGCKPVVEYSARGFRSQGVDIPIPQLGGSVKVGQFTYQPQTLNTLYRNVAILDALRLGYCADRVAAAQTSLDEFRACNKRIQEQEEKIAALAIAATQGESEVEEAVHKYGTAGPAATPPTNPETKKVDTVAAANAKKEAEAAAAPELPKPAGVASPAASVAPSPTLPPHVAALVKSIPAKTLLKVARRPAPSPGPVLTN
jgi:hypothetical protein